jgi:broad specificity phosphatase PhoE
MKTRVLLIRHGATIVSTQDPFAGSSNVPLSEEGRQQASKLAERLSHGRLDAVYCSPMDRTIETATIIGAPHDLKPTSIPGIREIDYGNWEGLEKSVVASNFSGNWEQWQEDPYAVAPAGGESGVRVLSRALPALLSIVEENRGKTVAVIAHKGTNRLLISSLLGLDVRRFRDRLDQKPAALNILDFDLHFKAFLCLFNDTSHYER